MHGERETPSILVAAATTGRILVYRWMPWLDLEALSYLEPAPGAIQRRADAFATEQSIADVEVLVWETDLTDAIPLGDQTGGVLILTAGLIELLDDDALDAAIAHELAHIEHGHVNRFLAAIGVLTAGIALGARLGGTRSRARGFHVAAIGTSLGILLLLALTRRYEREADRSARRVLDEPAALARAILAVRTGDSTVDPLEYAPPDSRRFDRLLSIYPPPEERFPGLRGAHDRD